MSVFGKRSLRRPANTSRSAKAIFGALKSLKALISKADSAIVG